MDCEGRIKDLLPDFYLDQLPPDEAEEVRRHLAEHAACREALEAVAGVLDLMPYAAPAAAPPVGLKERAISRALADEPPVTTVPPAAVPSAAPSPDRERRGTSRVPAMLAAAAAVLILALVGFSYLSLERENDQLRADLRQLQEQVRGGEAPVGRDLVGQDLVVLAVEGTGRAPGARGTAVLDASEGALALDVYNLPAPPEGHSYQAWLLDPEGGAVALGQMETDGRGDGRMAGQAPDPLASYAAVQVTLEPENSEERSGPVLMEAEL